MTINLTSSEIHFRNLFNSLDPTLSSEIRPTGKVVANPGDFFSSNLVNYDSSYNNNNNNNNKNENLNTEDDNSKLRSVLEHQTGLKIGPNFAHVGQHGESQNDEGGVTVGQLENKFGQTEKDEAKLGQISGSKFSRLGEEDDFESCEDSSDCGQWAECVRVLKSKPKRCWCVDELRSPDPETGACGARITEKPHPHTNIGVLSHEHLKNIVYHNVTGPRLSNETSSVLGLPTGRPNTAIPVPQIIASVFGIFFVVTAIVFTVGFIYRRRSLRKQLCAKRNGDHIVRNNDGAMLLDRMNNINRNPIYFYPNGNTSRKHNVKEVLIENLKLLDVVGEGAFGQVFKGELFNPDSSSQTQVAVKVLKDGATHEAQEDFVREVEIMATFDHDNILRLLGVVVQGTDGSPYMIFEYMEHGDLSELLRKNDSHLRQTGTQHIVLNKTDLVDVSVQIASGMSYLAAQRFVHRDLATRNCLVGAGMIVKISDFGMSRDIYTNDYYRIGGSRMLPVRWMSPEAIKYGRFTCESDIWSYGVVLWEIFSYGKQPYYGHSNEEVIHFLDQGILLQRPEDSPSTIYHVMLGCWKKDPRQRIVFDRLVKYLTDYRNRLTKPPHAHQQQHLQNCGAPTSKLTLSSNFARKLTDTSQKVDTDGNPNTGACDDSRQGTIVQGLQKSSEDVTMPKSADSTPASVVTIDENNPSPVDYFEPGLKSQPNKSSLDSEISDSQQKSDCAVKDSRLYSELSMVDSPAVSKTLGTLELMKQPEICVNLNTKTTEDKRLDVEKGNNQRDMKVKTLPVQGSDSPLSMKYIVATFERKRNEPQPASVLEPCPNLTLNNQNNIVAVQNSYGHAISPNNVKNGNVTPIMANKFSDK